MILDAKTLVTLIRQEPGYEEVIDALAADDHPRICATALTEAGMLLTARGHHVPELILNIFVDRFGITVMPFTKEHWHEAVRMYQRSTRQDQPLRLGECLSRAVAAKTGASNV